MTTKEALQIAASHVTIVGDEIYMPYDWDNPRDLSFSIPIDSDFTPQQCRAEVIAYGMCDLLERGRDACLGCDVDHDDHGGQRGAMQIFRRATYRQTAHDLQSYTS